MKYSFDLGEFVKIGTSAKVVRFELPGSLTKQSDIAVSGKALSMTAKANTITTMVIDGAEGGACKPDSIIPYVKIHSNSGWDETTDVKLNKGDSLVIGPHPWEGGRWVWTGPKDFGSTSREIRFKNMDGTMSGYYKAVHTNASGCEGSVTFKVVVDDPAHPFVEPDTSVTDSSGDTSTVALRGLENAAGWSSAREPVQVFDVQGHFLKNVQNFRPQDFRPGIYIVKQGFRVRQIRVE